MLKSGRDALLVTVARIGFVGLWFLVMLLIYRTLGDSEEGLHQAGLFAIGIAIVKVVSGCIGDPLDLAMMRRVPPLFRDNYGRAVQVLRAAFGLRLAAALVVSISLVLLAKPLSSLVLGDPDASPVMLIVAAAVVGDLMFRSILAALQAEERFGRLVGLEGAVQVGRFVLIGLLVVAGDTQVEHVLGAYASLSIVASLFGLLLLPRGLFAGFRVRRADVVDLLQYLKWMVPAMILAAFNERLDVFLVSSFEGVAAAGLYGAVLTIALVPDLLAGSLSTILQPKMILMHRDGSFLRLAGLYLRWSLPIAAVAILIDLSIGSWFITLVLGERFAPAAPAFTWLVAATLIWLAVTPFPMTLVGLLAPRRIMVISIAQLAIILSAGLFLLPTYGIVGMAQAVFAMRVAIALILLHAGWRLAGRGSTDEALGFREAA